MKMSMKNAWDIEGSKSLDAMFEGLEAKWPQYKAKALNKPPEGPWLVHFEDFVKEEESKVLLKYTKKEFDDAGDDKGANRFGTYRPGDRTNKNAWCTRENGCATDRKVKALQKRISKVVGAPVENFENLQILNYGPGQRYQTHHDHEGEDTQEAFSGPRVLTFFMYFNDVEEGGETHFPWVNGTELGRHPGAEEFLADISDRGLHYSSGLAVRPRKGSAVLWASVGDDLHQQLHETHHAALPVIQGTKFAANAWVHLRDLDAPSRWQCEGKPEWPKNHLNPGDPPGLFYDQRVPAWMEDGMAVMSKQEL
jgi:prolyl 4-hydroxylase